MSDWGSHGDGHPDNTRTPLIAWGSGVAKPVVVVPAAEGGGGGGGGGGERAPGHEDGFSADWNLNHIQRNDVSQADIAALMAYLIGSEFPVNSVGELPLNYLAATGQEKAEAVLVNAREILEMYQVKEERKRSTKLNYRPFSSFGHGSSAIDVRLARLRTLIDRGRPDEAIDQGLELIRLGLEGLRYLQRYDWFFLRTLVATGFVGWMAFALITVVDRHVLGASTRITRTTPVVVFFLSILVALDSFLWMQRSPWTYYAYAFFPVLFWEEVWVRRKVLVASTDLLFGHVKGVGGWITVGVKFLVFVGSLEILVSFRLFYLCKAHSASSTSVIPHLCNWKIQITMLTSQFRQVQGYFDREIFSYCYVLLGLWPVSYGLDFVNANAALVATWTVACVSMGTFTLLPVVKVESINLM